MARGSGDAPAHHDQGNNQITSLKYQMMNLIRAEIRNPHGGPPRVRACDGTRSDHPRFTQPGKFRMRRDPQGALPRSSGFWVQRGLTVAVRPALPTCALSMARSLRPWRIAALVRSLSMLSRSRMIALSSSVFTTASASRLPGISSV